MQKLQHMNPDWTTLNPMCHRSVKDWNIIVKQLSDVLYLEVNKLNLILSGLDEPAAESTDSLIAAIESILQVSTGYFIHLDHAYRVGTGIRRKVKLRFLSIKDRNAAHKSSSKLPPTVFINEDLPSSSRQAHGKLRAKLKELKSNSTEEIKVDWKKLSIWN